MGGGTWHLSDTKFCGTHCSKALTGNSRDSYHLDRGQWAVGSWEVSSDVMRFGIHRLGWQPDSQGAAELGKEGVGGVLSGGRKDVSVRLWKLGYLGAVTGKTVSSRTLAPCPERLLKQTHWPGGCSLPLGFYVVLKCLCIYFVIRRTILKKR